MGKVIQFNKKRGKIYITSIEHIYDTPGDLFLFCTTYSNNVPEGTYIVEQLSPSFDLLFKKKVWLDKGIFKSGFEEYRKLYLEELKQRIDTKEYLEKLEHLIAEGKEIVLFDNCYLKEYCHLNILKDFLINKHGFRVEVVPKYFGGARRN